MKNSIKVLGLFMIIGLFGSCEKEGLGVNVPNLESETSLDKAEILETPSEIVIQPDWSQYHSLEVSTEEIEK